MSLNTTQGELNISSPKQALSTIFGYHDFRGSQLEVIQRVLAGDDSFVIMPTGGGKSLCYQIPALLLPGVTLVFSPLLALMEDQVNQLKAYGVQAAYLNSMLKPEEEALVFQKLYKEEIKLLYLAPERFFSYDIQLALEQIRISFFAIDEAHCISTWGHDFRPEYARLSVLKQHYHKIPIMALTATADRASREEIFQKLQLKDSQIFLESFARDNIKISLLPSKKRLEKIIEYWKKHSDDSGIIYCLSRKTCESLQEKLSRLGVNCAFFHAGLGHEKKIQIQRDFSNDKIKIICATIAFGMGINKSNVRFVIHYNMPKNLESYYQEIGRAGRDGLPSDAILFSSYVDYLQYQNFIDDGQGNADHKIIQREKLERMFAFTLSNNCRRNFILNYFGEFISEKCGTCDNCLFPQEQIDGSVLAQKALSAIYRTDQRIGMNMVIDILRGSQKHELLEANYHQLPTYGVGSDLSFAEWENYMIQFLNLGLIELMLNENRRLGITRLGWDVLRQKTNISIVEFSVKRKLPEEIKTSSLIFDKQIFKLLKEQRKIISEREGIAPYLIFADKVLREMASTLPQTKSEFREINGVGDHKLERFADDFLEVLRR